MTSLVEVTIEEHALGTQTESAPIAGTRRPLRVGGAGPVARLAARVRAGALDRQLIAGANPACSAQLAARAEALLAPTTRVLTARGLEALLEAAQGPRRRWCAVGDRNSLIANAQEIGALAVLLRGETPVRPRGVAILGELLSDGTGPAYRGASTRLADRLHEARVALHA